RRLADQAIEFISLSTAAARRRGS
ncbi:MAG: hypothetical protein JWP48_7395, partial [Actinoallomurus sp.]|nr:hypothetical protein [Actinoallomurus sp.]